MRSKGLTVAVTGAAGYIASKVIQALDRDEQVERVLGFDVASPKVQSKKLIFDEVDVRNPALKARFQGVDVVIHLAFIMDPIRDEGLMRDVNVNGSQNVFTCAAEAGVRKIVYTSSATVYGAHPDNSVPLTEDAPLRANLDFSYPAHKLEVEYVVREFRREHPNVSFVLLRPAIVFGPHVDNAWSRMMQAPVFFAVDGYSPLFQFVHEDDVGRAIAFATTAELDGVFNVAAEGWLTLDELLGLLGRRSRTIGEPAAFALSDKLWSWGLAEAPAGLLHYVMHPWVVATDKLTSAGFSPTRSNPDIVAETVAAGRDHIVLGGRKVSRRGLKVGAAVGLGAAGGAVIRARRKKRAEA
jgi:nucleoside-diphosphate-sugar epimerase